MSRRKISLSSELHLVVHALDGMQLLTRLWNENHFTEEELPQLALALHATMVIVRERLVLLDHGIRDSIDPRQLSCPENEAVDDLPGDERGVVLRSWSTKETAERLRKEAERAERRLRALRERRKAKEG